MINIILNFIKPSCILLGLIFIGLVFYKKPKLTLLFLIIYFWIISVMFKPSIYDDLYRYYTFLDKFRALGWDGLCNLYNENYWFNSSLIYQVLLYMLSTIKSNNIATSIVTIIIYSLIGILNFRICKDIKINKNMQCIILVSQFIAIDLYSSISSWLYMLTLSILANILYTDLVHKKHRFMCLLLYLVLGSLHTISYTILLFRLVSYIPLKKIYRLILLTILFWKFEIKFILLFLEKITSQNYYVMRIIEVIKMYATSKENIRLFYMINILFFASIVIIICKKMTKLNDKNGYLESVNKFISCICFLIVGSIGSMNIMFRYSHLVMMFIPLYIGKISANEKYINYKVNILQVLYFICVFNFSLYYIYISYRLLL